MTGYLAQIDLHIAACVIIYQQIIVATRGNQPIILPDSLEIINNGAFQDCTSLPGVQVNAGVSAIPEQCFLRCSSMTEVQLAEGLQSIGRIAFANCTSLQYLEIPRKNPSNFKIISKSMILYEANKKGRQKRP